MTNDDTKQLGEDTAAENDSEPFGSDAVFGPKDSKPVEFWAEISATDDSGVSVDGIKAGDELRIIETRRSVLSMPVGLPTVRRTEERQLWVAIAGWPIWSRAAQSLARAGSVVLVPLDKLHSVSGLRKGDEDDEIWCIRFKQKIEADACWDLGSIGHGLF